METTSTENMSSNTPEIIVISDKDSSESSISEEPRKGSKGSFQLLEKMSQQELFKSLDQLVKAKEEMRARIDSIAKLLPKLNERRELLTRDFDENQRIAQQLSQQVVPLYEQMEALQRSIPQKQGQKTSLEANPTGTRQK